MLEVKEIIYEKLEEEIEEENKKRSNITYKCLAMLIISLILLFLVVGFIDISQLFKEGIKVTVGHVLFTITIMMLYVSVIAISLINIINYIIVLRDKSKEEIDYSKYLVKVSSNESEEELLDELVRENVVNIEELKKSNLKKIKQLNRTGILFIIVLGLSITLEIFSKFIIR